MLLHNPSAKACGDHGQLLVRTIADHSPLFAQTKNDTLQIKETVLNYLEGLETNNPARVEKAMHVLSQVNLTDRSHHKPNELSGGQCQRVAIARALVNDPSWILADEPTGNLDTKTSYEIMEIFGEIHRAGNTVVLVTHEEDIAKHAHRVVRLRDGLVETDKRGAPMTVTG